MSTKNEGFYHLGLAPDILTILQKLKFVEPTAIQKQAIPLALTGKDIMGVAQTGTGKTMAFGIPTVQRLAADGGQAVILVPTRELAIQVSDALEPLLKPFQMKSAVLIGGIDIRMHFRDIKKNPDVIIATPGRLNDLIYRGVIDFAKVKVAVLDEADRMLDMGFEPQVKSILRCLPRGRQTMLFSATMPQEILKLATKYMELPITIEIAPSGTTVEEVSQELFIVKESRKKEALQLLLQKYCGTVLVFTRTKRKASRVAKDIRAMGVKGAEIHSDRSMSQRANAIEGFKRGRHRVLVATDIAARGIDVSMIELVVNYDLPDDTENYIHRIGRTGRAGETGHSVTMATPTQSQDVRRIENMIKMSLPRTRHEKFSDAKFVKPDASSSGRSGQRRSFGGSKGRSQGGSKRSGPKGSASKSRRPGRGGSRSKSKRSSKPSA